jgi:hypothetical protein
MDYLQFCFVSAVFVAPDVAVATRELWHAVTQAQQQQQQAVAVGQ